MTISTITINTVDYTAYASVAEADDYLAIDPTRATTWAALTSAQKGAKLVAATRRLDLLTWAGSKTSDAQANQWPRTGVTCDGVAVATDEVPQTLEDATALLAGTIALDGEKAEAGRSGSNIKAVGAGSARVEFFRRTTGAPIQDETVYGLIRCLLATTEIALFGTATGTDDSSSFSDVNDPDRHPLA